MRNSRNFLPAKFSDNKVPFLDLFELKFVSKRFHELVNSDISFRKILELTDSMSKQVLWRNKIQKNLSDFKQALGLKFNDDPMLQLYLKHKVSSIFDRLSLHQLFCHFAFSKRCCDQDTVFCQMCSCVFPNYRVASVEYDLFDEIIIDNRFSERFKAFFLPKYHMYLNVVFPYYKYIDSTQSKLFGCLYYEA